MGPRSAAVTRQPPCLAEGLLCWFGRLALLFVLTVLGGLGTALAADTRAGRLSTRLANARTAVAVFDTAGLRPGGWRTNHTYAWFDKVADRLWVDIAASKSHGRLRLVVDSKSAELADATNPPVVLSSDIHDALWTAWKSLRQGRGEDLFIEDPSSSRVSVVDLGIDAKTQPTLSVGVSGHVSGMTVFDASRQQYFVHQWVNRRMGGPVRIAYDVPVPDTGNRPTTVPLDVRAEGESVRERMAYFDLRNQVELEPVGTPDPFSTHSAACDEVGHTVSDLGAISWSVPQQEMGRLRTAFAAGCSVQLSGVFMAERRVPVGWKGCIEASVLVEVGGETTEEKTAKSCFTGKNSTDTFESVSIAEPMANYSDASGLEIHLHGRSRLSCVVPGAETVSVLLQPPKQQPAPKLGWYGCYPGFDPSFDE